MGCGYGSLVNYLNGRPKITAYGLDADKDSIIIARELFPGNKYDCGSLQDSMYPGSLDYVILKDTLHHVFEQGEFQCISAIIKKVLKPGGKLIIFDPNVNILLKTARVLSKHKDAECSFEQAVKLLTENNYRIIISDFTEFFGLPLSGGYVGISFIPRILLLHRLLISLNEFVSHIISKTFLKKHLLWRYLIIAEPL